MPNVRLTRYLALALLAALWLAMLLGGAGPLDASILQTFYVGSHPLLTGVARGLSVLGQAWVGIPVVLIAVGLLAWSKRPRDAVAVFVVVLIGRMLIEGQKYGFDRARPAIERHLVRAAYPSFPSGHAGNSMIVCLVLALVFFGTTRWRMVAFGAGAAISLMIGFSRIMLGVHWPSDVVAGWAFGLFWFLAFVPLLERLAKQD